MADMRILFLGAGDAFSAGGRQQASYLVESGETTFLLDCGATTLAALKREGVSPTRIDTIFISHLHGDHFAGLPFLFLDYTFSEPRTRPLRIAGPPGTEERVHSLFRAMYSDSADRPLPFRLDFIELLPQKRLELGPVRVDPFRVPHQEREISLGMALQVDRGRILYSGDTGWTEELVRYSGDKNLFICECCFFETRVSFHLDYPRLWENHGRFGAERLILTHTGREIVAHRREIELEVASDGLVVEIQ
jgi:ribonuclease BN (tRNA processing enzyme)